MIASNSATRTPTADEALEVIAGERDTETLLTYIRVGLTGGDELHRLVAQHVHDDAWLRGACRVLQRAIERR